MRRGSERLKQHLFLSVERDLVPTEITPCGVRVRYVDGMIFCCLGICVLIFSPHRQFSYTICVMRCGSVAGTLEMFIYFHWPIVLLMSVNLFFFLMTACNLRRGEKNAERVCNRRKGIERWALGDGRSVEMH